MICRICGTDLLETSAVCETCGMEVSVAPTPRAVAEVAAESPELADVAPREPEPLEAVDERPRCTVHPEFPLVATCLRCGKFVCVRCAPEAAEREKPRCEACVLREDPDAGKNLVGIGGWLVLFAIQLVSASLLLVVSGCLLLFGGSAGPGALFLALGIFASVTTVLFFQKKKIVPLLLLVFLVINGISQVIESGIGLGVITTVLWCGYVLSSKRVKNTFVR